MEWDTQSFPLFKGPPVFDRLIILSVEIPSSIDVMPRKEERNHKNGRFHSIKETITMEESMTSEKP